MAATFGNLPKKGETVRGGKVISNWDPSGYKRVKKSDVKKYWAEQGWRYITDTDTGKSYKVPADDYQEFYAWFPTQGDVRPETPDKDMIKYIKTGFQSKHSFKVEGCGHIKYLEYDEYRMLLRVTFWNDDICVYFRVPAAVAGELKVHAETKQEQWTENNGKRHLLGIRFWDLVRIRTTVHGTRYRFIYTKEGGVTTQDSNEVNWTKGKYFFVPDAKGTYKPVPLEKLTPKGEEMIVDSIEAAQEYIPFDEKEAEQSIKLMYTKVNNLPTAQIYKDKIIKELDSMHGDEASMRNYLGILGIY